MTLKSYRRKKKTWDKKVKKRKKKTLFFRQHVSQLSMGIVLLLGVTSVSWWGYSYLQSHLKKSPSYTLTKIEVYGTKLISTQEIHKIINVPEETNIFSISLKEMENKLLSHSLIEDARVERKWPSTLRVIIKEREPLCKVQFAQQEILLDKTGNVICGVEGQVVSVPLVSGTSAAENSLRGIAHFASAFKESDRTVWATLKKMIVENNNLVIELLSGGKVIWGEMDISALSVNMQKFLLVKKDLEKKGLLTEYIDLRFKNVVVKPIANTKS